MSNHNNAECEAALKECNVELVVLGGTRIIKVSMMCWLPLACVCGQRLTRSALRTTFLRYPRVDA